jgi:hypothetical protein
MKGIGIAAVIVAVLGMLTTSASAVSIDNLTMVKSIHRSNGTEDGYDFSVIVKAPSLSNGVFLNLTTNKWYGLTSLGGGLYEYTKSFATKAAMDNEFASSVSYHFYFNQTGATTFEDQIILGYVPVIPTGAVTITNPAQGQSNVPLNPLYQWTSPAALGGQDLYYEVGHGSITDYEKYDTNGLAVNWTAPGLLTTNTTYEYDVAVIGLMQSKVISVTTLMGEVFDYYGAYAQGNSVDFNTNAGGSIPEPATLSLVGTAVLAFVGWRRRASGR